MFKMSFNADALKGPEPIQPGIYKVVLTGFKPKLSKSGTSINLNPQVKIVEHPDYENRQIFTNLNTGIPAFIQDFVHSFGIAMEDQLSEDPSIPGAFDGDPSTFKEDDPSTWKYVGPLLGKVAEWEVGVGEYNGQPNNVVRKFICSVPNCATLYPSIKHSADMGRKS